MTASAVNAAGAVRRRAVCAALVATFAATLLLPGSAYAAFGLKALDATVAGESGTPATQAGSHPGEFTTTFELNTRIDPKSGIEVPDGALEDLRVDLPPGIVGTPTPVPYCSAAEFVNVVEGYSSCPDSAAVGISASQAGFHERGLLYSPVYNLVPPPGVAAKLGFVAVEVPVSIEIRVSEEPPYHVVAEATNVPQSALFYGSSVSLWGNPASPIHDPLRGHCIDIENGSVEEAASLGSCPVSIPEKAFLTLPRSCSGPLTTFFSAVAWNSGAVASGSALLHGGPQAPNPPGITGCSALDFSASTAAAPTAAAAASPTGLEFGLDVEDEGLTDPDGRAQSDVREVLATLPEGMTANPAVAEGLAVCTRAQLAGERADSAPGAGCPAASKIGAVEVETPLLEGTVLKGSLFEAPQDYPATTAPGAENPFDSLLALYMVIKDPKLGIVVKQPIAVEADAATGRLTATATDLPQIPFSHVRLHVREGARSPLVSPPACGTYETGARLTPWSGGPPIDATSTFQILSGPSGGPCPVAGPRPLHPTMVAGTLNNAAGKYSPFYFRLSRADGEQQLSKFSIELPPGLIAKLAGIPYCPDAAIEAAKLRTGAQEEQRPACPAISQIGRTLVGAGVGPSPSYAPGRLYLAGPYHGSALSVAAITSARVGPFDLGTVVVREALKIDPRTAEVSIDPAASDPLPQILDGIPLQVRDIRVYVDRPDFVLNPTSCKRTSTTSTVFGSEAGNAPVTVSSPFQAADCAGLGFKPKLALSLKGGTKRGDNPAFKAVLTARPGDANIGRAQVTLPHSAFLDQAHIKTICTRAVFAQGPFPGARCPKGSIYGYARAITPLLDEPVQGPVYLRSSNHPLPDLVAALHSGEVDINLVGRIDSVGNGQIRNTFESVPDAPVKTFTLTMQGGKKGLLVNSTNLCRSTSRAKADFTGHNGKRRVLRPVLKVKCGTGQKKGGRK